MERIEFWVVDECLDRSITQIGNFYNENDAREVMERDNKHYRSVRKQSIIIFESVNDFQHNTEEKIRERALSKLTPEERKVLGL